MADPKPENVRIIQITCGTPSDGGFDPYLNTYRPEPCSVEVYGLGDDGELYWRYDRQWVKA